MSEQLSLKDLKFIQNSLSEFVERLGQKQIKWQQKVHELKIMSKQASGIATYADVESERLILRELLRINKQVDCEIEILSEEMAYRDKIKDYEYFKNFDYCWVVDPLDGTNNFVNGIDFFAISIGLVKKGKPIFGMVYRPPLKEMFTSIKGQGTYYSSINQKKIKLTNPSKAKDFSQLVVGNGFGMKKTLSENVDQQFFMKMLKKCRAVRRLGSAALDFCFVASGKLDAYWERGLCPWDVVAGIVICEEANIRVTDLYGNKVDAFGKSFLLANKSLHKKLIKI